MLLLYCRDEYLQRLRDHLIAVPHHRQLLGQCCTCICCPAGGSAVRGSVLAGGATVRAHTDQVAALASRSSGCGWS
jgi:hypothetical protein